MVPSKSFTLLKVVFFQNKVTISKNKYINHVVNVCVYIHTLKFQLNNGKLNTYFMYKLYHNRQIQQNYSLSKN